MVEVVVNDAPPQYSVSVASSVAVDERLASPFMPIFPVEVSVAVALNEVSANLSTEEIVESVAVALRLESP